MTVPKEWRCKACAGHGCTVEKRESFSYTKFETCPECKGTGERRFGKEPNGSAHPGLTGKKSAHRV